MKVREHGNATWLQVVWEKTEPHPQPLSKERGVKCLGNRKQIEYNWRTYHSLLLGEGLGERLYSLSPFFCLGLGVRLCLCQLSSSFLTFHGSTKQKWRLYFSVCARPFYGFNDSVFIFLLCNSIHHALHFDADYTAIWGRLRDDLRLFRRWFDANCMDFHREHRTLFECNFITTWLSVVYKTLKMRRIWDKSAPSVWIYKPNESYCKVLWKDLTYFLLIGISERHRHEMKRLRNTYGFIVLRHSSDWVALLHSLTPPYKRLLITLRYVLGWSFSRPLQGGEHEPAVSS